MSLRARLLIGLVAVIAVFLIVMGTVSIIVLSTLEQDQFNASLRLAGRQSVAELVKSTDGYSAVYLSLDPGTVGELTADSPATAEMRDLLEGMADQAGQRILRHLAKLARRDEPFSLRLPGQPSMLVTGGWSRAAPPRQAAYSPTARPSSWSAAPPAPSAARSAAWCWPS